MRIVSVVGARPQFVKLAPVAAELGRRGMEHRIVHTGQHYDWAMSGSFFDDLSIPAPDVDLGVGSGPHGVQTGQMLIGLEPALVDLAPDWVLVYGDTNSTIAAALAAVKNHLPVAHLEAGLRSFNRTMPEEHNRVLTDHACDLLLAPTAVAMGHLRDEGLADRAVLVGDVMTDVCLRVLAGADDPAAQQPVAAPELPDRFVLATLHRPSNTDDPARLATILDALAASPIQVILTAHPRLTARCTEFGIEVSRGTLTTVPPLAYPQMIAALSRATAVVTDSGGLQKEAYLVGTPCTTLRAETEWPETIEAGWNRLDPDLRQAATWADPPRPDPATPRSAYGAGDAAARTVDALLARAAAPFGTLRA